MRTWSYWCFRVVGVGLIGFRVWVLGSWVLGFVFRVLGCRVLGFRV